MLRLADRGEGSQHHRCNRNEYDDLLPFMGNAGKCHNGGTREDGNAGNFRRSGEESGDRRRRSLVDVRRPHVEGHRGNLEAKADEQEHKAEYETNTRAALRCLGNPGKIDGAGEAVDQRSTIEQHPRRKRAKDEIFQTCLGRPHVFAIGRCDHIERQAHQLQPEIERDQIGGRDQHQHAKRREQEQCAVFELLLLLQREIVQRQQ